MLNKVPTEFHQFWRSILMLQFFLQIFMLKQTHKLNFINTTQFEIFLTDKSEVHCCGRQTIYQQNSKSNWNVKDFHWRKMITILYTTITITVTDYSLKVRCDERFTHAFTACGWVFKEITLVGSNQGNYFEKLHAVNARWKRQSQLSLNYNSFMHLTKLTSGLS